MKDFVRKGRGPFSLRLHGAPISKISTSISDSFSARHEGEVKRSPGAAVKAKSNVVLALQ